MIRNRHEFDVALQLVQSRLTGNCGASDWELAERQLAQMLDYARQQLPTGPNTLQGWSDIIKEQREKVNGVVSIPLKREPRPPSQSFKDPPSFGTRSKKAPKQTQKEKLQLFKRAALNTMASYEDDFPLGHYFMWVIVTLGGKRKYKICIGSGRSSMMEDARAAIAAMPGVDHAWYNLD